MTQELPALQNQDGGWGYAATRGSSWIEPTVLAILALGSSGKQVEQAAAWMRGLQRSDGGFPPNATATVSTWVTALAILLPPPLLPDSQRTRAVEWLLSQTARDATWVHRLRMWMLGSQSSQQPSDYGFCWYPDTAAWLVPSALTLVALDRQDLPASRAAITDRIASARRFIWSRICSDGGWNHGSSRALGYESQSYPETTGIALLSLRDSPSPDREKAIAAALRHSRSCKSAEGLSWLQLGLLACGRLEAPLVPLNITCRTTMDLALTNLARKALGGQSPLWAADSGKRA